MTGILSALGPALVAGPSCVYGYQHIAWWTLGLIRSQRSVNAFAERGSVSSCAALRRYR